MKTYFLTALLISVLTITLHTNTYTQTTLWYQGFENSSTTCTENWGYTGGVRNNQSARTGSYSARVGRSAESNTITMNTINTTGLTNLQVQIYHSVLSGSGPGMDTREGALFLVSLNGGAYTVISGVSGNGDYSYAWSATSGGIANTCPSTYTTPNPLVYNVPAGTTSIAIRVISIGRNSSTCANFNTAMAGTTAYSFDRTDEGFFIDDVRLVTTSTVTDVTWNGSQSTNWFCEANWTPPVIPTSTINATFSTSNSVSQNDIVLTAGTTAICKDLNIIGGSSNNYSIKGENGVTKVLRVHGNLTLNGQDGLDFSDGTTGTPDGTIELKGNWDNQIGESHFKQGECTMILNGTGNQNVTITGAGPEIFYNLQVNKSSGYVQLNDPIEVCGNSGDPLADRAGVLTLTSGNVVTGTNYIYAVNPAVGGVSGGGYSSYVDGNFRRQTNTTSLYDYPTGEGTRYMRAGIRPTSTSVNVVEVNANNTGYGTYSPLEASLYDVSHYRWWNVTKISGSSAVSVRLYWGDPTVDGIVNVSDLVVAHYSDRDHAGAASSTQWWNRGRNAGNSSALITDGYVESSETMATFSPFTIATLTPVNPLPVELMYFTVACNEGQLNAEWATASEHNNAYFTLQGSTNGYEFNTLTQVTGAGNSNQIVHYASELVNTGQYAYYRLIQTDENGDATIYDPVYTPCELGHTTGTILPGGQVQLFVPARISGPMLVDITDIHGKTIFTRTLNQQAGNPLQFNTGTILASGIYIIRLTLPEKGETYVLKLWGTP